jgi:AMMECR1 domain-containing protein
MATDQGKILLPIARAAIAHILHAPFPVAADETAPWLAEPGASFITLTQYGELRGCIGTLQAHRPLLAGVELMHMIRKGQFVIDGADTMSFADQFYVLTGKIRPV